MSLRPLPDDVSGKYPSAPQPQEMDQSDDHFPGKILRSYKIQVVTPVFGGGVEDGVNDPLTPIRGTSIRGHLRFWWRATRGMAYKDIKELQMREGEIWGTTDHPSPVIVDVEINSQGRAVVCGEVPQGRRAFQFRSGYPGYALFPFQENKKEKKSAAVDRENLEFSLSLRFPANFTDDVCTAVWAWANFGGVGARTRRGCGALFCKDLAPASRDDLIAQIRKSIPGATQEREYGSGKWPALNKVLLGAPHDKRYDRPPSIESWRMVVSLMQDFRQKLGFGRADGSGTSGRDRYGRSFWPEADSLRGITGRGKKEHMDSETIPKPKTEPAFPRAELGLPIIFHFIDNEDQEDNGCELRPLGFSRMSSPVILRPLVFKGENHVEPMIVVLNSEVLNALELHGIHNPPPLNSGSIRRPDLAKYTNSPLGKKDNSGKPYSASGSALEGFLNFARDNDFREVWP